MSAILKLSSPVPPLRLLKPSISILKISSFGPPYAFTVATPDTSPFKVFKVPPAIFVCPNFNSKVPIPVEIVSSTVRSLPAVTSKFTLLVVIAPKVRVPIPSK